MWQSPIGCLVCTSLLSAILLSSQRPLCGQDAKRQHGEIDSELLIVGGTESGCAAAIQAARMGVRSIVLVSDTKWLGGQFSTEALVAIDESADGIGIRHEPPIPRYGLFEEATARIEAVNQKKYGVARPGNTRVLTTCRPADAAKVFEQMVQPYVRSGQLRILRPYYVTGASIAEDGHRLASVRFRSAADEDAALVVRAQMTIDASSWGDAIKAAGASYEFGPDLKGKYKEPEAPTSRKQYPKTDLNAITYCMVIEETNQYEPIPKPLHYDVRNYRDHRWPKDPLWLYGTRRIVDRYHYKQIKHPDALLLCFPAFDYPVDRLPARVAKAIDATERGASTKNLVEMTRRQRQIVFDDAKQYSLGFLYFLQTTAHDQMKDKTHSFRRFKLTDEFGTPDRMPPQPYVRESLRLKAMYMMRQQDTLGAGGKSENYAEVMYPDSVAVWQFEFDFHPTQREFLDGDDTAGPWRSAFRPLRNWGPPFSGRATFPMRSLIPERIDGLLGAQHNLGFSSIVSAAVRLHDHSMAVGQAAGAVAAVAIQRNIQPRAIPLNRPLVAEVWNGLCTRLDGGEPAMLWPFRDLSPKHPAFIAANLLAVRGGLPLGPTDVDFRPDENATGQWRDAVVDLSLAHAKTDRAKPTPAQREMSRGEFVIDWWAKIKDLPQRALQRKRPGDFDGDGIADANDPLPTGASRTSWPDATTSPKRTP